jgi:hypothetical protein
MVVRRWQKVSLGILLLLVCLGLAARQLITVSLTEFYSPGWHSSSSRDAEQRGVLLARLPVTPDSITLGGQRLAVEEAWVEPQTHVIYRYFLFRRLVRDPRQLLIVRTSMPDYRRVETRVPGSYAERYLAYNASLGFSSVVGSRFWIGNAPTSLPDTVRLFTRHHW